MSTISDAINRIITKKYPEETLEHDYVPTGYISTRIPTLDLAIGRPGIPLGRWTLICGEYGTGKSTLLYSLIAETQARGGIAVLLETEQAVLPERLTQLGVDYDELEPLLYTPRHLEDALNLIIDIADAARAQAPDRPILIGWDSLAGTPLKKEVEGEIGDAPMGGHAKLMSQMGRKFSDVLAEKQVALVIVNQMREKMNGMPFADNRTMLAARALNYHSSLTLEVKRVGTIAKEGKPPTGIKLQIHTTKNKLAAPYRMVKVNLDFERGFDIGECWLDAGIEAGVLRQAGSWFYLGDLKFQRKDLPQILANPDHPLIPTVRAAITPEDSDLAATA